MGGGLVLEGLDADEVDEFGLVVAGCGDGDGVTFDGLRLVRSSCTGHIVSPLEVGCLSCVWHPGEGVQVARSATIEAPALRRGCETAAAMYA